MKTPNSGNIPLSAETIQIPPEERLFYGAFGISPLKLYVDKTPTELLKLKIYLRNKYFNIKKLQLSERLKSFNVPSWKLPTASKHLAEAGFYFVGPADYVECYQCGLGLKNWNLTFCPFEQHLYYNPHCTHTLLIKRDTFSEILKQKVAAQFINILNAEYESSGSCYSLTSNVTEACKTSNSCPNENGLCVICTTERNDVILFPCRHISTCGLCTSNIWRCSICNSPYTAFSKVYVSGCSAD